MSDISLLDTFSFNGEPVVKLRLEYLYPYVERFYIIEASQTHTGKPKEFLYRDKCSEWFLPSQDKIEWIIVKSFPTMSDEWKNMYNHDWVLNNHEHFHREAVQRNASNSLIKEHYENKKYLLFVCDVDEIPNMIHWNEEERVKIYNSVDDPIYLQMLFFHYKLKWIYPYFWENRPYVLKDTLIGRNDFMHWRINHPFHPGCKKFNMMDGGWHLSYFMDTKDIIRKLKSIAHTECDKNLTEELIEDFVNNGKNPASLGTKGVSDFIPTPLNILAKLPKCFLESEFYK
jgi:hypothetical protein